MLKLFVKVLLRPPQVLVPRETIISFVGIHSLTGRDFDMVMMILFGVLGDVLRKIFVPTVPVILGHSLGWRDGKTRCVAP